MMDFGGAEDFSDWSDELPVVADRVVRRWWRILMDAAPWRRMPLDDALGNMRRILSEVLNEGKISTMTRGTCGSLPPRATTAHFGARSDAGWKT